LSRIKNNSKEEFFSWSNFASKVFDSIKKIKKLKNIMAKKYFLLFGFGSFEPFLDILFLYDEQDVLVSVKVLSVCGVTTNEKQYLEQEQKQEQENVCKIHLDAFSFSELKSWCFSLPDKEKSFSEFLFLMKEIYKERRDFFEPYLVKTNWYPQTSSCNSDFAQGYPMGLNCQPNFN
jgi:hypothetical protein